MAKKKTMGAVSDLYLPDECWEHVFSFLNDGDDHYNRSLNSLLVVSKQFLRITNRLRSSITIIAPTHLCLSRLLQRCPNLTYLNLTNNYRDELCWISSLAYSIRIKDTQNNSVDNSNSFVVSPRLKSLHLTCNSALRDESVKMIASAFPNLQSLDLSNCCNISEEGIFQVLRTCSNIRDLNLTRCFGVKLHGMNFEVPKLEVLNLSQTKVDDETLYVMSKSCCGLLKMYLQTCYLVTLTGVKHVLENCTQLIEIDLRDGKIWHQRDVLVSLILSRPSLKKFTTPYNCYCFSDREMELLARQGCIIC